MARREMAIRDGRDGRAHPATARNTGGPRREAEHLLRELAFVYQAVRSVRTAMTDGAAGKDRFSGREWR